MDILILNWKDIKHPSAGGAEIIAFEFARRLVRDGHKVTFFASGFSSGPKKEVIEGINVIRKGNLFTIYLHAFLYYKSIKKKPGKVLEMINTICWQTWLYVPQAKRIAYLNQLAKEVWFFEFPKIFGLIGYIFERFEYLMYKNTHFLCYSESTKGDLVSYGIPPQNISLFPLGLDHERYKSAGRKSIRPLFIFVARLVPMKRADICIKAMKSVVKYAKDAELAIIGFGPQEEYLQRLVQSLSLDNSVKFVLKDNFHIYKSKKDIKVDLMQRAWALLLPSVKEGWGMVVTEAAACGTPAIVSNVTGLRDSVVANKTGIILTKNPSEHEMADAMLSLIKDAKLRKKLSQDAAIWAKNFYWSKSYKRFKELLLT